MYCFCFQCILGFFPNRYIEIYPISFKCCILFYYMTISHSLCHYCITGHLGCFQVLILLRVSQGIFLYFYLYVLLPEFLLCEFLEMEMPKKGWARLLIALNFGKLSSNVVITIYVPSEQTDYVSSVQSVLTILVKFQHI